MRIALGRQGHATSSPPLFCRESHLDRPVAMEDSCTLRVVAGRNPGVDAALGSSRL